MKQAETICLLLSFLSDACHHGGVPGIVAINQTNLSCQEKQIGGLNGTGQTKPERILPNKTRENTACSRWRRDLVMVALMDMHHVLENTALKSLAA